MYKVLTIAGSDCSGGAGIQADIKTITAHKMYAMSTITALTAQNTTGVFGIVNVESSFVSLQLDTIFNDIRPDAVKIGMVSEARIIKVIAERLRHYDAKNIVTDPVMVSTSGSRLLSEDAESALKELLLPLSDVITPNISEAEVLSGFKINHQDDMIRAARFISSKAGAAVLIKGGHIGEDASDILFDNGKIHHYTAARIDNPNTHGTGCTLSAAIACNLASGKTLSQSIQSSKEYLTGALKAGLDIGKGRGPLDHTYRIQENINQ